VSQGEPRSYYGRAVLAEPTWTWEIPTYFWVGGMAGVSAPLALLASLRGNDALARRAAAVALAGAAVSPGLLISDLGRPERFFNMLRVFKVTSPMSVGSWTLAAFGASATAGAGRELLGVAPRLGRAAQVATLALGPALATYTGALVANTAVPVWHEARRELPFLFGAGAAATAGAMLVALTPPAHAGPARRLAIAGSAAELAVAEVMERRLGQMVGEPYHQGTPARLARAAKALTGAGAVLLAAPGRARAARFAGAGAVLAGGLLERWAVYRAGFASAADPRYTVAPQRERRSGRR
jgi:hypothetical protein